MDVAVIGWVVLASIVLGVLLWNYGVRHVGVVVASVYMNLVPIVAVAILALLGTPPTWTEVLGGLLVVTGVGYVQLRQAGRRRRAAMAVARHSRTGRPCNPV
jgi:drug/metabolite transporter (DMT)-like permease